MSCSILWRKLDQPGHDAARLRPSEGGWCLEGSAVFLEECGPCRLDYAVTCDAEWRTLSGRVKGWIGERDVELEIVSQDGRWTVNGIEYPAAAGCIDLDLNFTPATNLLSLRRLALEVGEEAQISVAWLRFPELTLEPLPQLYRHQGDGHYWYDSNGGEFTAELRVNAAGFVVEYPPLWESIDPGAGGSALDEELEAIQKAKRRATELASGVVSGRPHDEVLRSARRALEYR